MWARRADVNLWWVYGDFTTGCKIGATRSGDAFGETQPEPLAERFEVAFPRHHSVIWLTVCSYLNFSGLLPDSGLERQLLSG